MSPKAQCALCLEEQILQDSHIIPKFVGRHLKATSATGYLRNAQNVNRREELPTTKLLCAKCETRFSKLETWFSRNGFAKIHSESYEGFDYDASLLQFAVSVSWRVLRTERDRLAQASPNWTPKIDETLEAWRMFLLGEYRAPRSEHHLFVLLPKHTAGVPSGADPKTPHYQMRTADAVVRADETTLAVYAKLEQAVFYSPIVPAAPNGLKLTRIHAGNGRMALPQEFKLRGFWHFLQSRVEYAFRDELSEKQLSRIAEAIAKDPQRARESESLRVHQETRVLLDATAKPPDDAIE